MNLAPTFLLAFSDAFAYFAAAIVSAKLNACSITPRTSLLGSLGRDQRHKNGTSSHRHGEGLLHEDLTFTYLKSVMRVYRVYVKAISLLSIDALKYVIP